MYKLLKAIHQIFKQITKGFFLTRALLMINTIMRFMMVLPIGLLFLNVSYADTSLIDTKVRYDKKFDFNGLNDKFQWVKRKDSSREHVASTDPDINEYFLSVVNKELRNKGFQQSTDGSASFGIDYVVIINKTGYEQSLTNALSNIRRSRNSATSLPQIPDIEHMNAGTIILNIVNMKNGYRIWIGHADAVVVDKENREELIDRAVAKMLAEFPPK
jgi:uncharacterized protein DUF4136